jgi:hypothetical protein
VAFILLEYITCSTVVTYGVEILRGTPKASPTYQNTPAIYGHAELAAILLVKVTLPVLAAFVVKKFFWAILYSGLRSSKLRSATEPGMREEMRRMAQDGQLRALRAAVAEKLQQQGGGGGGGGSSGSRRQRDAAVCFEAATGAARRAAVEGGLLRSFVDHPPRHSLSALAALGRDLLVRACFPARPSLVVSPHTNDSPVRRSEPRLSGIRCSFQQQLLCKDYFEGSS